MDELVNRLRLAQAVLSRNKDLIALLSDAADAIEEQQADKAALNRTVSNLIQQIEELSKPRWIPVEERLPEKTNHYLVHVKCGCDGELVSAWEQVAWFCEKFYWEHLHGDDVFEETVTHWMPLPEPPREE